MASFKIIAAVDQQFGIGKEGGLPWRLPADLKHFRRITVSADSADPGNVVIMGRRTWDSLPETYRPLPNRINWVITANAALRFPPGVQRFASVTAALNSVVSHVGDPRTQFFIIGGARVYEAAVRHPRCQKLYLTHILHDFNCDTFFPDVMSRFRQAGRSDVYQENGFSYYFAEYLPRP